MRVAAVVRMSSFPYWRYILNKLAKVADDIYICYDENLGDPEILKFANRVCGGKVEAVEFTKERWGVPSWRERNIRMLDNIDEAHMPDIVLTPDQDEVFDDFLRQDLERLMASDKDALEFRYYPLESEAGFDPNRKTYPERPHVKAFKYKRGLTYYPYHGFGVPAQYYKSTMKATSRIRHYCAFTSEMEAGKGTWREKKSVTMVGFGPSGKKQIDAIGEIWSLNNCYEVLAPDTFSRTTRIYEMHLRHKRDREVARDGKLHLAKLSEMGATRRIIMHQKWDDIRGSEAYPLMDIIGSTGLDWFAGTPCYMIAQAIHEGYNHIRIYGLDQMDWEHTLQRECFAAWICYAKGRGITVDGKLTFLEPYVKRYGYDYGPEFDKYQEELLWRGHPIEIHYKIPSRVVAGKLYDGGSK